MGLIIEKSEINVVRFRVYGLGFWVQGFGLHSFCWWEYGVRLRVQGSGCTLGLRVQGLLVISGVGVKALWFKFRGRGVEVRGLRC
jgi:hypothetical protein